MVAHRGWRSGQSTTVPDVDCHALLTMEELDAGETSYPSNLTDGLTKFYGLQGEDGSLPPGGNVFIYRIKAGAFLGVAATQGFGHLGMFGMKMLSIML